MTNFANCWRLARRDGVVLGFTDHDHSITFGGVTFEAAAALESTEITSSLGLSADDAEASGALSSEFITDQDLRAGLYDGAAVDLFEVDWSDPTNHTQIGAFELAEIERNGKAWRGEMRSRAARLDQAVGGHYLATCPARLGDQRCGVDTSSSAFKGSGVVLELRGLEISISGLGTFESEFFSGGVANVGGVDLDVRASLNEGGFHRLVLWQAPGVEIAPGDAIEVIAGCNGAWSTCRNKFGNEVNFRGFPHMVGEAALGTYARPDSTMDGGSRFDG